MVGKECHTVPDGEADPSAAAWFARMRSDERTPEDEQRFRVWLEADPERAAAYAGLERTFNNLGDFAEAPEIRAMREAALHRPNPAIRMFTKAPRRAAGAALAACLALVILAFSGAAYWPAGPKPGVYQTEVGERSIVHLDDGTIATLTSETRLVTEFTADTRQVRLEKGQAYFEVMSDAARPFVVDAGKVSVTALGTEFDVNRKGDDSLKVTLVEGSVAVKSRPSPDADEKSVMLKPGEQVACEKEKLLPVREVDTADVISWRYGVLKADGEPFVDFVERFNSHSRYRLFIDKDNPLFRGIKISGSFRTNNPDGVVDQLRIPRDLYVLSTPDASGNIKITIFHRRSLD